MQLVKDHLLKTLVSFEISAAYFQLVFWEFLGALLSIPRLTLLFTAALVRPLLTLLKLDGIAMNYLFMPPISLMYYLTEVCDSKACLAFLRGIQTSLEETKEKIDDRDN